MFRNKLRQMHAGGQPILNGWLSIGSTMTAEIMAAQGYDSVTIDMQHGALDYRDALLMMQAMRGWDVTPVVRVPWREPGIVMKALDAGAQAIICPMINTAREAADFVSLIHYPPKGQRSSGPTRAAVAYGGYGVEANDEVLGFAMIETRDGVENLDEIVAVPGLGGVYVGPSDLTLSTQGGRLGPGFDREEPEMIALIQTILAACKRHGIMAGLHCGTPDYAARAIGWGFDLTTLSGDTALLAAAASQSVRKWRERVGGAPVGGGGRAG
ncbi:HpcH/HpaI aldolase family protein [Paracoccus luteus]|uniref:HpcH/HpaI aldolase family protein n=1 Tax=Paracoccus luteus TaxID=2508543 RepID=UPI00106FACF7|nr:aldolase/citrate lyase family protein [Paracoccus luteus]